MAKKTKRELPTILKELIGEVVFTTIFIKEKYEASLSSTLDVDRVISRTVATTLRELKRRKHR